MKKQLLSSTIVLFIISNTAFAQDTWTKKADFGGAARHAAAGFSIGNKGYIGTGTDDAVFFKDFWEWDQASNTWTKKADFPGTARREAIGFSIGKKGYIGMGCCPGFKDLWEWDGDTASPNYNTWTKKADFPPGLRTTMIAFVIGNKAYIGMGDGGGASFERDIWEFDPAGNSWTQKGDFPGAGRTDVVAFSIGNKGYVGIGDDDGAVPMLQDFWEYNPGNDTWTRKADFPGGPRTTTAGFSAGNKGYIGMGDDDDGTLFSDFWEYNPVNDNWTQKADFGGGMRTDETGFAIGNKGYIGIGALGGPPNFKDFWEYTPDTSTGISENLIKEQDAVMIYPNPFSNATNLLIKESMNPHFSETNLRMEICDVLGRKVQELNDLITNTSITISRNGLPNGVYFYKIITGKEVIANGKLVIQ